MMSNIFSIFDPSLSLFGLSWFFMLMIFLFLPLFYWASSFIYFLFFKIFLFFKLEVYYVISNPSKGVVFFVSSIFFSVFFMNFLSIFPHIFSITSHMLVTLPYSFVFWLTIVFFCWFNFLFHFLCHLIPVGTPFGLLSFMVIVELISNFIRPVALTFRLTANMMAGHLLMSLVGSFLVSLSFSLTLLGSLFQSFLVFMELGVSVIQAYVFSTLLTLYVSEGN